MKKNALIIGWGKSGFGSAKLLQKLDYNIKVFDDCGEVDCKPYEDVSNCLPHEVMTNVDLVVLSPSITQNHDLVIYAQKCGIEVIGEIELGYRNCKNKIIAITGTNGKTTTTILMRDILVKSGYDAKALGNIGKSFCGELADISENGYVVLEVSSFQLETTKDFRPDYAMCLNVTPDHLDRHGSFENYFAIKRKIFCNQTPSDYAIINYDDTNTRNMTGDINSNTYYFSLKHRVKGAYLKKDELVFEDLDNGSKAEVVCKVSDLWNSNAHNISNALACIVVAKLLKIENSIIKNAFSEFKPPRYRIEYVCDFCGKKIFNDSKATNIDSTLKACACMKGDTALIVGGFSKGISYHSFFVMLPSNIKHIIASGDNVYEIMQFMPEVHNYTFEIAATLERACEIAVEKNVANVLFSPTTSSYDRYSSFIQRGEHFNKIISDLVDAKI